jgi:DNA-directed RNA polymerase specialized sigma subunit
MITVATIRQYPFLHNAIKNAESAKATSKNGEIATQNKMRLMVLEMKVSSVERALESLSIPDRMIIESRFFDRNEISRIDGGSVNTIYRLCKKFVLKVAELLGEE